MKINNSVSPISLLRSEVSAFEMTQAAYCKRGKLKGKTDVAKSPRKSL